MKDFSHIDKNGKAAMVDVSEKNITKRTAEAYAEVKVSEKIFSKIKLNEVAKGDVLTVAKIAGIQAAKRILLKETQKLTQRLMFPKRFSAKLN